MHDLGMLLLQDGHTGEAEEQWLTAAEVGHTLAMNNLGVQIDLGNRDMVEAEQWLRRAAASAGAAAAAFRASRLVRAACATP